MNFTMQQQKQTNWCWAAVSTSVSKYYRPTSSWTQCRVANAELGQTTCCSSGGSTACNQPWFLDRALARTGNHQSTTGALGLGDVQNELNANRPLCARVQWSGGGGHFVAFSKLAWTTLTVDDPWYGRSYCSYSNFKSAYMGTGSWTHSYYTKSP